jgi:hypothetical protein
VIRALAAVGLVVLGSSALAADRDVFAGRVAGNPRDCIPLADTLNPMIVDAQTIVYRQSGRRLWRTGAVGRCVTLRTGDTLIVEVANSQICRNDRFRVVSVGQSIPSGTCRFSAFVPYDKP